MLRERITPQSEAIRAMFMEGIPCLCGGVCPHLPAHRPALCELPERRQDRAVAGAPAEVAVEVLADLYAPEHVFAHSCSRDSPQGLQLCVGRVARLRGGRGGVAVEQRVHLHDPARRAKPALAAVPVGDCGLRGPNPQTRDTGQRVVGGSECPELESLDRTCTACMPVCELPRPSVVMMCAPSTAHSLNTCFSGELQQGRPTGTAAGSHDSPPGPGVMVRHSAT